MMLPGECTLGRRVFYELHLGGRRHGATIVGAPTKQGDSWIVRLEGLDDAYQKERGRWSVPAAALARLFPDDGKMSPVQPTPEHRLRCGDTVRSKSTGEELVIAYADYETGRLSWYGWPGGRLPIDAVELLKACDDAEHRRCVSQWLDPPHHVEDHRPDAVRRLYRPEEHRRVIRERRAQRIAELETELSRLRQEQDDDR